MMGGRRGTPADVLPVQHAAWQRMTTTAILDNLDLDVPPRTSVLGVNVSAVNMTMALQQIESWIDRRQHDYVCITGVHGVMESQRDPRLKQIHNDAGLVTPDGMPMVWINRLRGNGHVSRVYGPDLMLEVCARSLETGWKHFFYGGAPGVAEKLAAKLKERFPGLCVAGTCCPPFRAMTPEEDRAAVEQINASGADIVWVGLSTPKQEYWMSDHIGRISAPVIVGVGAAFDFHAGLKSQAPRWMQRCGLEWFYRLCTEPKRLWKRYLVNNPLFLWNFALQTLGIRDFSASHLD
jgi:N-acetylglucosaminyldiphosphoundecaprenol N-acetyl-beta-D-mannosaminyltransferase